MFLTTYSFDQVTQLYRSVNKYNLDTDAFLNFSASSLYRTVWFSIFFAIFTLSIHVVRYQDESKSTIREKKEKKSILTRRMTSIGRFAYKSETNQYPSNISWFVGECIQFMFLVFFEMN